MANPARNAIGGNAGRGGSARTYTAWQPAAFISENARSRSSGFGATKRLADIPTALAARSATSAKAGCVGLFDIRTPIFFAFGKTCRIMSSVFVVASPNIFATPVMFPPGCAKLLTNPEPIGSLAGAITIGIVAVAFCAAATAGVASATIKSGLSAINSSSSAGSVSYRPFASLTSIIRFLPSSYPLDLNVSRMTSRINWPLTRRHKSHTPHLRKFGVGQNLQWRANQ